MHTPLLLLAACCLLLVQCAHRPEAKPAATTAPPKAEWYIGSKDPLTYCPIGHKLPEGKAKFGATYVYLADRTTRFYIPLQNTRHMQQALAVRKASVREMEGPWNKEKTMDWVTGLLIRLPLSAAFIFGAGVGGGDPSGIVEDIWAD